MNVSEYVEGKLVSPYLGINSILDGVKKENELNSRAYGVLICLAVCDVLFTDKTKKNLEDEFEALILECNTEEDFLNVDKMLKEAADEGGYAKVYYDVAKLKLNKEAKEQIKLRKNSEVAGNRSPVSYISDNGKLESPYFDVSFRPTGYKNFKMDIACSGILMTLSVTDLKRDDESQIRLLKDFCDILLEAKSEEDHLMVKVFLDELVKKGGYAIEFNEQVRPLVGLANVATVQNILATCKAQIGKYDVEVNETSQLQQASVEPQVQPAIPQIQISTDMNGDSVKPMVEPHSFPVQPVGSEPVDALVLDFKESLDKFNDRYNSYKTTGQGDLEVLLRNARRLQDQLLDCMNKMDKSDFNNYDLELENKVKDIRTLMSSN